MGMLHLSEAVHNCEAILMESDQKSPFGNQQQCSNARVLKDLAPEESWGTAVAGRVMRLPES